MVAYVAIFALGRMAMPLWRPSTPPNGVLAVVVFGLGIMVPTPSGNLVFDAAMVGFGIAGYFFEDLFPMAPALWAWSWATWWSFNYRLAA